MSGLSFALRRALLVVLVLPAGVFVIAADDVKEKGLGGVAGPKGFSVAPRCPRGTIPVAAGALQPYRCVRIAAGEGVYANFFLPREMTFEYPRTFRIQDAWKEDIPTLYLTLDDDSPGKPVSITVTKYEHGQATYQELDDAIARDIEWQRAKDGGVLPVAGLKARVTYVPGDTRSVYLPLDKDSYYSFVYSAPTHAYEAHLPAFQRLLEGLRLTRERP
ncbi:MAG TPA: hypothetical protein DCZ01_05650 [Elusimicrobia bacterium]|nr:MAG: hypothetical protein A2X37_11380 [Elusimicrobia bacterium GWA2_66_18]HAZ08005.1 hypothetical protein [Elusimicrobiota bacterium]